MPPAPASGVLAGSGPATINVPLILGGTNSESWANNSSSLLTINGTVTGAGLPGVQTLTLSGTGTGGVTITGIISSAGSEQTALLVNNTGGGVTTLSGSNTYTGGTTLNAGTVILQNANALGSPASSALAFGPSSTGLLELNGFNITLTDLTTNAVIGTPVIENGASGSGTNTLTVSTVNTDTYGGALVDSGSGAALALTKSGAGTLTLAGASTYTGKTTVSAGTLGLTGTLGASNVSNGATFTESNTGSIAGSGVTFTNTAGAGTLGGANTYTGNTTVSGGTLNLTGTLAGSNVSNSATFAESSTGVINGAGTTYTNTSGTGTLGGSNTYTGATTANGGLLNLTGTLAGSNVSNGATFAESSTGVINGAGTTYTNTSGTGTLGGSNTYTGATTVNGGLLNLTGTLAGSSITNGATFTESATGVIGGAITLSNTAGTTTLAGANTYNGGTTLSGGTLLINDGAAATAGSSAIGTGPLTITGGAIDSTLSGVTLGTNNTENWNGSFTFNGTDSLNLGTGAVTLGTTPTVTVNANTLTVGGSISGGANGLTKAGAGTLAIGGSGSFTGATTISAGAIQLTSSNALATSTVTISAANGLTFSPGIGTFNLGGLAGASNEQLDSTSNTPVTLAVGANGASTTYSGVLSDAAGAGAGLIKTGTGTLTLSGSSTYTGNIVINSGTLFTTFANAVLNITASALGNPSIAGRVVTVNNGGTLVFAGAGGNDLGNSADTAMPLAFVINQGGTVMLNLGNTPLGPVTLNGGTLTAAPTSGGSQIWYGTYYFNGDITVGGTSPSTISSTSTSATGYDINLVGDATGTRTFNVGVTGNTGVPDLTVSAILGNGSNATGIVANLLKTGSGSMLLSATNLYTGTTTIAAGTLLIGANAPSNANGALGDATSAVVLGTAVTTSSNTSPSLLIAGPYTVGRPVTIAGQATSGTYSIGGRTDNNSGFSGLITVSEPLTISQVANTGANALTISGGITSGATGTQTLTFTGPGNTNVTTTGIGGGTGTLAVNETGGVLTLSASNSYTGATTIGSGATLNLTNGVLGNTAVTVKSGGTLTAVGNLTSTGLIGGSLTGSGGSIITLSVPTQAGLSVAGGITLGASGPAYGAGNYATLNFTLGTGNTVEQLDTAGALTLNTGGAYIDIANPSQQGIFILANFGGGLGGANGTIAGFSLSSTTGGVDTLSAGRNTLTLSLINSGTTLQLADLGASIPGVAFFDGAVSGTWSDVSNATYVNWSTDHAGTTTALNIPGANTDVIMTGTGAPVGSPNAGIVLSGSAITTVLGTSLTINSLNFNSVAASNTIAADGNTLTINGTADSNTDLNGAYAGNAAGNGVHVLAGSGPVTINVPVVLGGTNSQSWANDSSSLLTVGGAVSSSALAGQSRL